MKVRILLIFLILILPTLGFSQFKGKKCKEGCAPAVSIYSIRNDTVQEIEYMFKDKPNHVMISLLGGIENVKHTLKVTSKNAIIQPVAGTRNEYMITPQDELCEIIVDVITYEDYLIVRRDTINGKSVKKVVDIYRPKTYMIGYERIEVR
ncbi:MAG TPA: hypothetical protein VIK89_06145 [Cytophagaceae bacterium]